MSNFRKISMANQVFDQLENDIIYGIYPIDTILTEQKLAEKLGVARPYIREALQRLKQEHLVEDCGKGSRVIGILQEDILDIMSIRERIEGIAAYYATLNATAEDLDEMAHLVEFQDFYFAKRDSKRLKQVDEKFHDMICNLCGRLIIKDTLAPLHRKTRYYRQRSMEDWERAALFKQEHYDIYHAIADGNAQLALEVTNKHISNAKAHMIKNFSRNSREE